MGKGGNSVNKTLNVDACASVDKLVMLMVFNLSIVFGGSCRES